MNIEIDRLVAIMESFLGSSKNGASDTTQTQFNCPRCAADKGIDKDNKYNLEVNFAKNRFNCWACGGLHDEMHGSIQKLIKLYGNDNILNDYKREVYAIRQSKMYDLNFSKSDFDIDKTILASVELELPSTYKRFKKGEKTSQRALKYLFDRGIGWDIIEEYNLGYTDFEKEQKLLSTRIIIPSFNRFDELNYWVSRDYSGFWKKQKYMNPNIDKKDIIFNESKVQWDADITLVEGAFDHIVVPNSIPLLGKELKMDFEVYQAIFERCNANVNIFLDGDAFENVKVLYKRLNCGRLYNKIRYIPCNEELDPSKLYELGGKKAIINHLVNAKKFNEIYL